MSDLNAQFPANQKMAIVGRNGGGKSTLFKLIRQEVHCDEGEIVIQKGIRIGSVAQEMPATQETPLQFVLNSDAERKQLMDEAEHSTDPYRLADVHQRLLEINAYEAPTRAAKILVGLGFSEEEQQIPLSDFSGGWRMRVALAAALFMEPDLLLLDEPTNHLDLEATAWLENYLKNYPRTLLIISHDRHLLNAVVDRIYHLSDQQLKLYSGNYDFFEKTRKEQMLVQESALKKQIAARSHIQGFIDRFRANPARARLVQSRVKMLERFEPISLLREDQAVALSFPEADEVSPPLITVESVNAGYGSHVVLRNLNHRIDPDDRIALLGKNGNGKTTLAKIFAGSLKPLSGEAILHPKIKVGFFHQHQIDAFDINKTAYSLMHDKLPKAKPEQIYAQLGRFGIGKDMALQKVSSLSGGEKARLNFALISSDRPNILILDEPTNHLDIASRENLIMAINAFKGAVILIAHDRYLLEHTVDRYWWVNDGKATPFEGQLEDYYAQILGKKPKLSRAEEIKLKKQGKKKDKPQQTPNKKHKKNKRAEGFIMD